MGFNLRNAVGTVAAGVADVAKNYANTEITKRATMDIEQLRATIQADRDARQNEFAAGESQKGRDFTRSENVENRTHQTDLQDRGFTHTENMQSNAFNHTEILQLNSQDFQRTEGDRNRAVQSAGQAIQMRQVETLEKGAALERRIKEVQAKNAEEVGRLQDQYNTEPNQAKKTALRDSIAVLTGKASDKYLPLPLKDEMGNITGYQIFDTHRGMIFQPDRGAAGGAGGRNTSDPLGIRGNLPQPKEAEQPAARPAGGLIDSQMAPGSGRPGAPPLNPEAVASFDADAAKMDAQQLIAKYKPVFESLSAQQQFKYYEAEKKLPKRVPGFA